MSADTWSSFTTLRHRRSDTAGELKGAVAVRGNDLMELIDDRLIEIKAKQLADRKS